MGNLSKISYLLKKKREPNVKVFEFAACDEELTEFTPINIEALQVQTKSPATSGAF